MSRRPKAVFIENPIKVAEDHFGSRRHATQHHALLASSKPLPGNSGESGTSSPQITSLSVKARHRKG
jgi:hypothetical protein